MLDPRTPTFSTCRLLVRCAVAFWLGVGLACIGGCNSSETPVDGKQTPGTGEEVPAGEQGPLTAEGVLEKMAAAYQTASSYADLGTVRLTADRPDGKIDDTVKFSLTLVRPNKIRIEVYQARVVCDGKQLHAAILDLPDQVLAKEAPAELTLKQIYTSDPVLGSIMSRGFAGPLPQLMLMLSDDPKKALVQDAQEVVLGEPGSIGGRDCHRVEITHTYGRAVFWIDQQSHVLRRVIFPTDQLLQLFAQEGTVHSVSLVADFPNAQLDAPVDPKAFEFEVPTDARLVEFFLLPHPGQLLGKKVPPLKFSDLQGNAVTPESLAGKITVLDMWATWCGPCRATLPLLEQVYQRYQNNDRIAMLAVSVDKPEVEDKALQETLAELGVSVPILRDLERQTGMVFNTTMLPATFILDAEGIVQDFQVGGDRELASVLPAKLDKLLAGEDIYHQPQEAYQKELEEYRRAIKASREEQTSQGTATEDEKVPIPRAEIAQQSDPKTFRLGPLWQCTELTAPGNVLVVSSADGTPRVFVVDNWRSVAEVGPDGKVVANHQLSIDPTEAVSNLRTAVGADGKRYFAATSFLQQRFHLFDENFNLLFSHPQDALENRHPGISDVALGDLDGDGKLEALVAYRDVVGVKAVSLQGELLWSNRAVLDVGQLAIGGPDAQGRRNLFCTNNSGALAIIDAKGMRLADLMVPWRFLHRIVAADLTGNGPSVDGLSGDGQPQWCGMAVEGPGKNVAVGLNLKGDELWNYPMPEGVQQQPIEVIVAGRILPGAGGQWLLPGADGSIHLISADGKPLDRFNYGGELHGLATARFNGEPVLIVASSRKLQDGIQRKLEAWKVE